MSTVYNTKRYLANLLKARFPYIYINSWEEDRTLAIIEDVSQDVELIKTPRNVYTWSQTEGFRLISKTPDHKARGMAPGAARGGSGPAEACRALDYISEVEEPAVFVLKDFHVFFGVNGRPPEYLVIRKIRDLLMELKRSIRPKSVIFLSPYLVLPNDLQKDVTVIDIDLPTMEEIRELLDDMIEANSRGGRISIDLSETEKERICKAALGLTLQEAENSFARAMVEDGSFTAKDIDLIIEEKCQVIKKTGVLEFIKSDLDINDVGGLENLKRWIVKRNKSWMDSAKKYNLPAPKGVLITGIPGCGKSLTAKSISAMWQIPLLRLDIGKIFSGLVGSSEENMRKAIKTAEAVAPCILWVDEIEKGLSGSTSGGDSGTSSRVFGTFLTWMQEKTHPVFVVATANNISNLPPELLRKGRFDEIFFVDLPTFKERREIFRVHLLKRLTSKEVSQNIDINEELLDRLAGITEGFVGAEIEQAVVAALYDAFFEDRPLEVKDLEKAIKNTVPLSVTQSEQIQSIRAWASVRAVAATAQDDRAEYVEAPSVPEDHPKVDSPQPRSEGRKDKEYDISRTRGGRTIDF